MDIELRNALGCLRKGTEVLEHERFHNIDVEVSHNYELCSCNVLEHLPVVCCKGFKACSAQHFVVNHQHTARLESGLIEILLKVVLRVVVEIREQGLYLLYALVVFLFVEARLREVEIGELEGGLKVLAGRVAADSVGVVAYSRTYAELFACEHFAYHCVREYAHTAVLKEEPQHIVVK